ncbi:MAG: PfkB family carbohydrate kinase [Clostridiales bacterium]|nr:PfkB family carbohydrate kinase [Clostridiales bacterium]MDD7347156.1 PfkB family carbohydrate kinase [Clostridiales bacterium]MDY4060222.1 PfkB family carbohydrate kinase [Anaerovoracaceae bacterium]
MVTDREHEVLKLVKQNPMISQQELAEELGITRSSVAVHISNLMKKGEIQGKGYVIGSNSYVVVVGGLTRDVGGKPFSKLIMEDSNPGTVKTTLGGVGRNIAHNISLLGIETKMLTAVGSDQMGKSIRDHSPHEKMDFSHILGVDGQETATYLYIADQKGDMVSAIADMQVFDHISPEYVESKRALIGRSKAVVVDANIPLETMEKIANLYKGPIFVDPVSTEKGKRLKSFLKHIHTLKPNKMEAEMLSGVTIVDEKTLKEAADVLLKKGVKRVFISLGRDGVYAACDSERILAPTLPVKLANVTGGGDCFMAGLVYSYMNDLSLVDTVKLSLAASAMAVEGDQTINEEITIEKVLERAGLSG